jgi:chromosome segregation ATPase
MKVKKSLKKYNNTKKKYNNTSLKNGGSKDAESITDEKTGRRDDFYDPLNLDNTTSDKTIEEKIKEFDERINENSSKLEELEPLKTQVEGFDQRISENSSKLGELKTVEEQVKGFEGRISDNSTKLEALKTQHKDFDERIRENSSKLEELETKHEGFEKRINENSTKINELKTQHEGFEERINGNSTKIDELNELKTPHEGIEGKIKEEPKSSAGSGIFSNFFDSFKSKPKTETPKTETPYTDKDNNQSREYTESPTFKESLKEANNTTKLLSEILTKRGGDIRRKKSRKGKVLKKSRTIKRK